MHARTQDKRTTKQLRKVNEVTYQNPNTGKPHNKKPQQIKISNPQTNLSSQGQNKASQRLTLFKRGITTKVREEKTQATPSKLENRHQNYFYKSWK